MLTAEWTSIVKQIRNYPCVFDYTMNNEDVAMQKPLAPDLYKLAKQLDPKTRKSLPEDNWVWSPQGLVAMHYPERWGIVEFARDDSPGPAPQLTHEDAVRAALFDFYYRQRAFRKHRGRWAHELREVGGGPLIVGSRWQAMKTGWGRLFQSY